MSALYLPKNAVLGKTSEGWLWTHFSVKIKKHFTFDWNFFIFTLNNLPKTILSSQSCQSVVHGQLMSDCAVFVNLVSIINVSKEFFIANLLSIAMYIQWFQFQCLYLFLLSCSALTQWIDRQVKIKIWTRLVW